MIHARNTNILIFQEINQEQVYFLSNSLEILSNFRETLEISSPGMSREPSTMKAHDDSGHAWANANVLQQKSGHAGDVPWLPEGHVGKTSTQIHNPIASTVREHHAKQKRALARPPFSPLPGAGPMRACVFGCG